MPQSSGGDGDSRPAEPASPPESPRGKTVGKYVLQRSIGRGHFAEVFEAHRRDTKTDRTYAVKVVATELLRKEGKEDALRKEIGILKSLHHPHIVDLEEVLQSAKSVYIVLEHVDGGDFLQLIETEGRLPEASARRYFQQLASALDYCHQRGVAHRDLKCENLLLTSDGKLKVADFGLSTLQRTRETGEVSTSLLLNSVVGSPHYLAPEVLAGDGYSGFCADVWSCGCILYVFISGRMPFDGATVMETLHKIVEGSFRFTEHFSPLARRVITRMLVSDPQRRYTIARVLSHEWVATDLDPALLPHRAPGASPRRLEVLETPGVMRVSDAAD